MNVLVIDRTALDEKRGGMARAISTLVESLLDQGVRVVRLIPGPWHQYSLEKVGEKVNIEYSMAFPLPYGPGSIIKKTIAWIIRFPKAVYQIKKIIDVESIDIIQTTYHSENIYIWVCSCLWKVKYVVTLHGSESFLVDKIPFWHRWLARIVVRGANAVIPVSDGVKTAALKSFGQNLFFERIYNGIKINDLIEHSQSRHLAITLPNSFVVAVGALVPAKGHDVLLHSWKKVVADFPDVALVIVGDGPEAVKYKKICQDLNIENSVVFLGWLNHLEVIVTLSSAILHVLPSRSEGFGLVLLEAGALKVANIATNVGGIPEIIKSEEHGLLVPANDPGSMAIAICRLLGNDELRDRIVENFYNYSFQNFSAQTMAERYIDLYKLILAQNNR